MITPGFLRSLFGRQDPTRDTEALSIKPSPALPIHDLRKPGPTDKPEAVLLSPVEIEAEADIKKLSDESKRNTARERVKTWKDAIQPHTDEGGDAHYIGDAYEDVNPQCAQAWEAGVERGPYLKFIQHISKTHRHLEYLAHWMLVGCAPPKWRFIKHEPESRAQRVKRTNVCVIDYETGKAPSTTRYHEAGVLSVSLKAPQSSESRAEARLVIVEDLSRDVVEVLGSHYDVDPLFFLSHISDYLFNATRDRWVELPDLEVDLRNRNHFNLSYLRPRYFKVENDFLEAERQSGMFNVLRRLDSDRSRKVLQHGLLDSEDASVTLSRAKTSLWYKPAEPGEPITAILLVDPTVESGVPMWGTGYRPFDKSPSFQEWTKNPDEKTDGPPRSSLFEDVVYYSSRLKDQDLEAVKKDPNCLAIPVLKLVAADWLVVLKYMTTVFARLEWSLAKPHWGTPEQVDRVLLKIAPWRRNIGYYQGMIHDSIARLFPTNAAVSPTMPTKLPTNVPHDSPLYNLSADFKNIKRQMDEQKDRIKGFQAMATSAVHTEEARRAVKQNKNLARLTFLATFFIPLNFTSSFLSMSPDFPNAKFTIWLFFALSMPVTTLAFILVDFTKPDQRGLTRRAWNALVKWWRKKGLRGEEKGRASSPQPVERRTFTMPWATNRSDSSYYGT